MKWFKHFADASNDLFVRELAERFGDSGYAFWFRTLELIAAQGHEGTLDIPETAWRQVIHSRRTDHLRRLYTFATERGKLKVEGLSNGLLRVSCPKFREISDEYSKKVRRVSRQTPDNVLPEQKEKEKEKREEGEVHPPPPVDDEEEDSTFGVIEDKIGRRLTPAERNELQQLSRSDDFSEAVRKLHGGVKAPIPFLRTILLNPKDFSRGPRNPRAAFEHTASDVQRLRDLEATLSQRDRERGEYPNEKGTSGGGKQPFQRFGEERKARGTHNLCSDCGGAYWSLQRHDCPALMPSNGGDES